MIELDLVVEGWHLPPIAILWSVLGIVGIFILFYISIKVLNKTKSNDVKNNIKIFSLVEDFDKNKFPKKGRMKHARHNHNRNSVRDIVRLNVY